MDPCYICNARVMYSKTKKVRSGTLRTVAVFFHLGSCRMLNHHVSGTSCHGEVLLNLRDIRRRASMHAIMSPAHVQTSASTAHLPRVH